MLNKDILEQGSTHLETLVDRDINPVHIKDADGEGLGQYTLLTDHDDLLILSRQQERQLYEWLRERYEGS